MIKLILPLLLLPFTTSAQKTFTAQIDDYMNGQVTVNDFSGNVLVAKKGTIIYQKAFGLADRELGVKNNLESKFQIGSLTKQFTACAILQLVEANKLKLDDTIDSYFPGFFKGDSITIHMLLNHTSGVNNYTNNPEFWKIAASSMEKDSMVALIKRRPLDFRPGSKYNYSNSGYFLLGYIVEKASGQSYSNYILNNVIKKAGLQNTFVNRWDTILSNRVNGYMKGPNGWQNAMYISMEGPYSAGAIISTSQDMYTWNTALFQHKIVTPTSLIKMTTPNLMNYGYGLIIDTFQNHLRVSHSGGIPGFVSFLVRFPLDSVVVVVLSNSSGSSALIANALSAQLFGIPIVPPYKHTDVKIDAALLSNYIGKYTISSSDTLQVVEKDGKLYRRKGMSDIELKPESNTKFYYADGSDRQVEFKSDKSGKITNVFFINNGIKQEIKKL